MAILDGSFAPLIGGVSQQHPGGILPGQVRSQVNMVSDPVTGPRRRQGYRGEAVLATNLNVAPVGIDVLATTCILGDTEYHVHVQTSTGKIKVYSSTSLNVEVAGFTSTYLQNATLKDLSAAFLNGDMYILNRAKKPGLGAFPTAPSQMGAGVGGFMWVKAGQFSKTYSLELITGGAQYVYSFTTPSGTTPGDANLTTPTHIVGQLAAAVNGGTGTHGISAYTANDSVFLKRTSGAVSELHVWTSAGSTYASSSGGGTVRATTELPPRLPAEAQGYTVAVGGSADALQYYYWDNATLAWVECGSATSWTAFTNMPVRLYKSGASILLDTELWPARYAGDENTNPYPAFTDSVGITGISSFQGRLVLLSGNYVLLSDSQRPNLFMRSTVASLLDGDAIEIASGGSVTNNAYYTHAIPYNRDLVLLSDGQISVIPGAAVLTPKTAQIVPSNTTSLLPNMPPVQAGNMIMYGVPGAGRTATYSGFDALLPSQSTSSQYSVEQLTDHLPTYFPKTPKFMASGGNSGFVVASYEEEPEALYVFQYIWKGQELALAAFHKWTTPGTVRGMYMKQDRLYLILEVPSVEGNKNLLVCSVGVGEKNSDSLIDMEPFLDCYVERDVHEELSQSWCRLQGAVVAIKDTGLAQSYAGELAAFTEEYNSEEDFWIISLHPSYPESSVVFYGLPYTSELTLPVPSIRDGAGRAYGLSGTHWICTRLGVLNSGEFTVTVNYQGEEISADVYSPLLWETPELLPGVSRGSASACIEVPLDGLVSASTVKASTSGTREMCFEYVDFTIKTERAHRRI